MASVPQDQQGTPGFAAVRLWFSMAGQCFGRRHSLALTLCRILVTILEYLDHCDLP